MFKRLKKEMISRKELAEYFGVTPLTIINWDKKGLPVYKNKLGRVSYNIEECEKWLNG